jgi:hypothetical protein
MKPAETSALHSMFAVVLAAGMLAACSSAPRNPAAATQVAAAEKPQCKMTRNMQSPGPQPPSRPPRCADSFDAGKLPATAIPPIMVGR